VQARLATSALKEAAAYLEQHLEKDDLCLILGSGTIDKLDGMMKKDA
jgi:UDP-N-acetylmuramate-alanine ligase